MCCYTGSPHAHCLLFHPLTVLVKSLCKNKVIKYINILWIKISSHIIFNFKSVSSKTMKWTRNLHHLDTYGTPICCIVLIYVDSFFNELYLRGTTTIADLRVLQMTPTSSSWSQLLVPRGLEEHWRRVFSEPAQCTSSRRIWPVPRPKNDRGFATAPVLLKDHDQ